MKEQINLAISYIESFVDTDLNEKHLCEHCGEKSNNQVDCNEVLKALDILRKLNPQK